MVIFISYFIQLLTWRQRLYFSTCDLKHMSDFVSSQSREYNFSARMRWSLMMARHLTCRICWLAPTCPISWRTSTNSRRIRRVLLLMAMTKFCLTDCFFDFVCWPFARFLIIWSPSNKTKANKQPVLKLPLLQIDKSRRLSIQRFFESTKQQINKDENHSIHARHVWCRPGRL